MFYTKTWEYEGHNLVTRPDTSNYYITWCKPGTGRYRRKSTGTSDLDEAKRRLIAHVQKRTKPRANEPHEASVLDCLVRYCERKIAGKRPPHAETRILRWWTEFIDREDLLTVTDLTLEMQEEFIAWRIETITRQKGSYSTGTINRDLATMRAALRDAWKRGRLATVPHVTMLSNPPPRDRILTREEVSRLINECQEPHLQLSALLALHTLQRPGGRSQP